MIKWIAKGRCFLGSIAPPIVWINFCGDSLQQQNIHKIVATFTNFKTVEKYAYRASFDEIKENEFNLNIPRCVDTFEEEEEEVDISAKQKEIQELQSELSAEKGKTNKYLRELGFINKYSYITRIEYYNYIIGKIC
jgi:hypothetical protein